MISPRRWHPLRRLYMAMLCYVLAWALSVPLVSMVDGWWAGALTIACGIWAGVGMGHAMSTYRWLIWHVVSVEVLATVHQAVDDAVRLFDDDERWSDGDPR